MKKENSGESLAAAAKRYIEAHSKERFSLEQMAGALYVNSSYLARVFKRYVRMTPLNYHHQVRCGIAKKLLAETDRSVSEVGETAGFVSSAHFSHVFRKTEGCSPSEYRMSHKNEDHEETEQ